MRNLENLSHAQRERLAFIDFCLNYFGEISRADLIAKFQTGLAAASRDFATYKEHAPGNLELVHQTKSYYRTKSFKALFPHDPQWVLSGLVNGFGDGLSSTMQVHSSCQGSIQLIEPDVDVISELMRAITQVKCLNVEYVSLSSGSTKRIILPHSLANSGKRWHVRAYDFLSQTFRDFVLTRFKHIEQSDELITPASSKDHDKQWNRIVDLKLIPHPKATFKEAIELDYGMKDGEIEIEVRAALAGYLLNHWLVDCSSLHHLPPEQYHLALKHPESIFGIENSQLAPGYKEAKA